MSINVLEEPAATELTEQLDEAGWARVAEYHAFVAKNADVLVESPRLPGVKLPFGALNNMCLAEVTPENVEYFFAEAENMLAVASDKTELEQTENESVDEKEKVETSLEELEPNSIKTDIEEVAKNEPAEQQLIQTVENSTDEVVAQNTEQVIDSAATPTFNLEAIDSGKDASSHRQGLAKVYADVAITEKQPTTIGETLATSQAKNNRTAPEINSYINYDSYLAPSDKLTELRAEKIEAATTVDVSHEKKPKPEAEYAAIEKDQFSHDKYSAAEPVLLLETKTNDSEFELALPYENATPQVVPVAYIKPEDEQPSYTLNSLGMIEHEEELSPQSAIEYDETFFIPSEHHEPAEFSDNAFKAEELTDEIALSPPLEYQTLENVPGKATELTTINELSNLNELKDLSSEIINQLEAMPEEVTEAMVTVFTEISEATAELPGQQSEDKEVAERAKTACRSLLSQLQIECSEETLEAYASIIIKKLPPVKSRQILAASENIDEGMHEILKGFLAGVGYIKNLLLQNLLGRSALRLSES